MADIASCPPLTSESVSSAYSKILSYIHKTPLLTSKTLNQIASHPDPRSYPSPDSTDKKAPKINLSFKCENYQKIGAFKARGAHHAIIRLIEEIGLEELRRRGVVTHSSGNHAQALALAASTFSIPSYIVMPEISTASKIASTKSLTPNVIFSGSTSVEREAKVEEVIKDTNAILVPPYDHPDILLGQGTAGLEMETQFKETHGTDASFDAVLTPLGGGGLLSGTATWFSSSPKTLVFGAEPSFQDANDGERGLAQDPPTRIPTVSTLTIADGLRTPVGVIPWSIISDKSKVEGVYSVTEEEIKLALRLMLERVKVFVEPSSVVPVAVILFNQKFREFIVRKQEEEGTGRPWEIGVVLSGGNTTVEALAKLFGSQ